jgi:CheY-like chemotaxis protein
VNDTSTAVGHQRSTILIVDDHGPTRMLLKVLLTEDFPQCCFREASCGEKALSIAAVEKPDIVIMDICLPGISGIEATKRMREILPNAKVIIISMYEDAGHRGNPPVFSLIPQSGRITIYIYTMNAGSKNPYGITIIALLIFFNRLSVRVSRSICLGDSQWRWNAASLSWWRKRISDVLFLSKQPVQQFVE